MVWGAYSSSKTAYSNSPAVAAQAAALRHLDDRRMTIDGVERAPLITDYERWRRLVIQSPAAISFQRMDDTFSPTAPRSTRGQQASRSRWGRKQPGIVKIEQPAPGKLVLDGEICGNARSGSNRRCSITVNGTWSAPRFRWVQDTPFNR